MKVLWMVSVTLPAAAAACGLACGSDVSGGWLTGQLSALSPLAELTVCSVDARAKVPCSGSAAGVQYLVLPGHDRGSLTALLRERAPDLVHIWGTEYAAAREMSAAAAALGLPVLIGLQGLMFDCAAHLCDGVPTRYLRSCRLQRLIDRLVPGALLDVAQARFAALADSEAALLATARYVTGRTAFDRAAAERLAPAARYFFCGETLRPEFYIPERELWQPHAFGGAPVIFVSQANYPLKNLHTLLKAMPALLKRWPGAELCIAGWPPLDKGALLRPLIDWMFPYQLYCKRLAAEYGLENAIRYTGPLDAAAMKEAYLGADVFVLPSYSENSPNSLGEAMLLGVPCVAAAVGGVPSLAESGVQAQLYAPAGDAAALACALQLILGSRTYAAKLGAAARQRALAAYDPAANAQAMLAVYRAILQENLPQEVPHA